MTVHAEQRVLPYTQEQMFRLVSDIESYPEFLPWCLAARINRRDGDILWADMVVGFRMVRERFTSKVTLTTPQAIDVSYISGPLKHMTNQWQFLALPDGRCEIDFYVDSEFRSRMLQRMIGALFHEAVRRMVSAFETRAAKLYRAAPYGALSAAG
jgi:coenzyme Q-binding protein COQ10